MIRFIDQKHTQRFVLCCALMLPLTASPQLSLAQETAPSLDRNQLRRWVIEGNKAYEKGEYANALAVYEKAYAMQPDPNLGYRIGQTHEKMGNYLKAQQAFELYLKQRPKTQYYASIEKNIQVLKTKQTKLQPLLTITTQPPGAVVYINGVRQSKKTNVTIPVGAGTYKIKLIKARYKTIEEDIVVERGQKVERQYVFEVMDEKVNKTVDQKKTEPDVKKVEKKKKRPIVETQERPLTIVDVRPPLVWSGIGWTSMIIGSGMGMVSLLFFVGSSSVSDQAVTFSAVSLGLLGVGGYLLFVRDWSAHLEDSSQAHMPTLLKDQKSAWGLGLTVDF